jgi:hypothetical protein
VIDRIGFMGKTRKLNDAYDRFSKLAEFLIDTFRCMRYQFCRNLVSIFIRGKQPIQLSRS